MSTATQQLLTRALGTVVLVKLKGGRDIRGILRSFDQHLNIVLEEAEELKEGEDPKKLGTIIVRGDNIIIISPSPG